MATLNLIPAIIEEFLKKMDSSSLKMDESVVIIDDEISGYELNDQQKGKVEILKTKCRNVQEKIKKNKK